MNAMCAPAPLTPPALRGKHIALLCEDPQCESSRVFSDAASALGVRVSRLSPEAACDTNDGGLWLLGRLYDAVECEHLPAHTVQRLRDAVAVPVFDGLGDPARARAALARLAPHAPAPDGDAHSLVRAVLLHTLS